MKKFLILFVILINISSLNAAEIITSFFYDTKGEGKYKIADASRKNYKAKEGYSFSLEYLEYAGEKFKIGVGVGSQFSRKIISIDGVKDEDNDRFNFMPIYLTGEYLIEIYTDTITPFIKANLGYASLSTDFNTDIVGGSTGDFYYAIGAGLLIDDRIKIQLMYSCYKGSIYYSENNSRDHLTYSIFNLGIGYVFTINDYYDEY